MPIMIDQTTLRDTLSWSQAIDYLEIGLAHEAAGRTDVSHKFNHDFDKGNMRILFAVDYAAGYGATKAYHTIDGIGSRYLVSLIDLTDGRLLAIVDGRQITDMRTGAASGVVARKMALAGDGKVVAVIGSGHQARAQLQAISAVLTPEEVRVFSPTAENRARFARDFGAALGRPVHAVASAEEAVRGAHIVLSGSAARTEEPILRGDWLDHCRLLAAVGNTRPQYGELDMACFERAETIVIDTDHALSEAGELIRADRAGLLPDSRRQLLSGFARPATAVPAEGMVLFKSVGTALQDLSLVAQVYDSLKDDPGLPQAPDLVCSG